MDGFNIVDPATDQTIPYLDCFDQAQGLWIYLYQYSITKKKSELKKRNLNQVAIGPFGSNNSQIQPQIRLSQQNQPTHGT